MYLYNHSYLIAKHDLKFSLLKEKKPYDQAYIPATE